MFDFHMHSRVSFDGHDTGLQMAQAAADAGLKGICFTDHMDFDFPEEPNIFLFDLDDYFHTLNELKEAYSHKLPIHIGVELGLQTQVVDANLAVAEKYPFDFIRQLKPIIG